MPSSSQEPRASGKPNAMFSLGNEEWETNSRVLFENSLIHQIWEDLSLKAIKIICLVRQDLNLWSKNIKFNLSIIVSVSSSNKLMLKDWNYQVRLQEELSLKERVLRDTQIRSMHEMGAMKRVQEQRVDEISVQKNKKNHETVQKLTSQLQEMQEQMNSMNDSGFFQEVESNYSGRLSHVSSQPAMIPSSRSVLSHDKRLPLGTWNTSGSQKNVFGNLFSAFDSPRNHPQRIPYCTTPGETGSVPQAIGTGTSFERDDKHNREHKSNADICKKAVDHEFVNTGGNSAAFYGWTAETANIGAANRQIP